MHVLCENETDTLDSKTLARIQLEVTGDLSAEESARYDCREHSQNNLEIEQGYGASPAACQ